MKRVLISAMVIAFAVSGTAQANETVTYSYDAQGRLTTAAHSGSGDNASLTIAYQYDPAGNRTTYIVTGSKGQGQQVVVVPLNGFTVIPINP